MTSFYAWRLMFMTFHGECRAGGEDVHEHVHESPECHAVPLLLLAVGAVLAGMIWHRSSAPYFIGLTADGGFLDDHEALSGRRKIVILSEHERGRGRPTCAGLWVKLGAAIADGDARFCAGLALLHRKPRNCRPASPPVMRELYKFLLNKWYFDEIYDLLFVARRSGWAGSCGRGDGRVIDGFGPDGILGRTVSTSPRRAGPAPDRLRLSLRIRHADRRRRASSPYMFFSAGV